MRNYRLIIFLFFILLFVLSCSHAHRTSRLTSVPPPARQKPALESVSPPVAKKPALELMGYTIQAGAFEKVENAVRLTERLKNNHGLDATYFLASDKLFKVRFGNFTTKEKARQRAQSLKGAKVIEEFYIVQPEDYSVARQKKYGTNYLREALVKTAQDFIGVPYLWGGTSSDDGFDCSGLTMTVYQLNGLNLPRNSARQFEIGSPVDSISDLRRGDLVFFSVKGMRSVSHVGIYIGRGQFIHASSQGKKIRIDSLSTAYFTKHYIGGKTYL
jgi:cell wall-associated NlpC family hydrolase